MFYTHFAQSSNSETFTTFGHRFFASRDVLGPRKLRLWKFFPKEKKKYDRRIKKRRREKETRTSASFFFSLIPTQSDLTKMRLLFPSICTRSRTRTKSESPPFCPDCPLVERERNRLNMPESRLLLRTIKRGVLYSWDAALQCLLLSSDNRSFFLLRWH